MSLADHSFSRRSIRCLVMWLLAVVLPLQGTAVGVFAVMGPAHIHKQTDAPLVLTDFRRWRPSPVRETHVFTFSGHVHGSASLQRHFHAYDDASVVRTGDDGPLNSLDADEGSTSGTSLASVLAMIPAVTAWAPLKGPSSLAERSHWTLRTGFIEPLDRPPKLA